MVRNVKPSFPTSKPKPTPSGVGGLAPQAWISRYEQPLHTGAQGMLSGLTFAAKDNIDALGLPTTAACPEFAYQPAAHAVVVQRLLESGAALVGKTNLDQFACGLNGTRSPYGAVPNAFNADYVCGGSSSGSAYVVATGQVDFALGTDTAGSGRVPAGLNNIVGFKPSKGLISTRGLVPAAQSVDCVAIFARTVAVAARVLQATMGYDPLDPYARSLTLHSTPWPQSFRFGVPSQLEFFGDEAAAQAFGQAIARLQTMGGIPVTIDYTPLAKAAALLYESALVAERYAAVRPFFDANEALVIEPVRSILAKGRSYSAADLYDTQAQLHTYGQQAAAMWQGIDVLLVPTAPTHYTIAHMQADPVVLNRNLGAYTNFVNLLDYAAISVPSSLRPDGLPFGITFIGPCGSDWQLADLGQRYHHHTGLCQGATGQALPAPQPIEPLQPIQRVRGPDLQDAGSVAVPTSIRHSTPAIHETANVQSHNKDIAHATMPLAVVGAHLSGLPLNGQLTERGARLALASTTATHYRLFALAGTIPPKPGLKRVSEGGAAIAVEVWDMPVAQMGSFLALIPSPLGLGKIELADGRWVTGFICEGYALDAAQDLTAHGGWRAYLSQKTSS